MKVLAGLVVFMFAALTTRLWFLQVLASDQFSSQANQNEVRTVPIQPLRGEIVDRHGTVLVGNRASTVVLVDRLGMEGKDDEVLYRLSNLLHVPVQDLLDRLNSVKYLPYQPVPVAEDVQKAAVFYIREHPELFPGVSYDLAAVRDYPEGDLAAHILGYTGEISESQLADTKDFPPADLLHPGYQRGAIVGKAGLEATYERYLHGENGIREIRVNAQGQVLDDNFNDGQNPPTPGDNVVLSIDAGVQHLAEHSLSLGIQLARQTTERVSGRLKATAGAVLVMDPRNGQVLAMASNPTYDPAIWNSGLTRAEAHSLDLCYTGEADKKTGRCDRPPTHNNPLLDRAIQGEYPPGSTFKPFVAAAAMKEHFATMNGRYDCPASYTAPGDTSGTVFDNWSPVSLGAITLTEALVISCDTVFYQFGWDYWVKYFRSGKTHDSMEGDIRSMGFGRDTGVDLPYELSGRVPSPAFKKALVKREPQLFHPDERQWLPGDYINQSIGQGFMLVTPLQLATGYSAIANGGTLYTPHVAWKVVSPDGKIVQVIQPKATGKLPISRRQVTFLRTALTGVPVSGTASAAFAGFPLSQIPVAGKTGTADIAGKQPFSWFAAMAPANHPRYVVVCMVEQGGHGATTAAPIVRRIFEGLFGLQTSQLRAGGVVD
jgi:penicillin-binding protein 2